MEKWAYLGEVPSTDFNRMARFCPNIICVRVKSDGECILACDSNLGEEIISRYQWLVTVWSTYEAWCNDTLIIDIKEVSS